jgi:hypothetical protein
MVVLVEGEGIAREVALSRSSRMGMEEDVRMISGAEIRDGGTLVPPPPPRPLPTSKIPPTLCHLPCTSSLSAQWPGAGEDVVPRATPRSEP